MSLNVDIVTPERTVFSGEASEVRAPGEGGEFGILPDHTDFLTLLRPGITTITTSGGSERYVTAGGFAEAGPDRVVLLVEACEAAASVNKADAQDALDAALKALETAPIGSDAHAAAQRDVALHTARLEA